ncbi:hypothetical protein SNO18_000338 [Salmonella enterica]|nr:hypothetical protein [Salmonella enterica]ELY6032502.1 hypothetical protein [Salmonella enterica]
MNSPHYFSAKALNDEIIARLLKDEEKLQIISLRACGRHAEADRLEGVKR